jgi:hypothetical protein
MSRFRNVSGIANEQLTQANVGGVATFVNPILRPLIGGGTQAVANNCWVGPGTFTSTNPGTFRSRHQIMVGCSEIQASFIGWYTTNGSYDGTDTPNGSAFPMSAALETADGVIHPFTFGGNASATVSPGLTIMTDALNVSCMAGEVVWVRTYQNSSSNLCPTTYSAGTNCGGFAAGVNYTFTGSPPIADSNETYGYGPSAILGVPTTTAPSVAIVGDSIASGEGDYANGAYYYSEWANGGSVAGGYLARALTGAGIAHMSISHAGEQAYGFVMIANRQYRMGLLAGACATAICEYGINDVVFGEQSLANVQGLLLEIWQLLIVLGMPVVWQTTLTPSTTSSDGWATLTNQASTTSTGTNTVRVELNDWLRAGAPLTSAASLNPVAVGTSGALIAGQPGHPLQGFFEAGWVVESSHDAATWTVANVRTIHDAAMTADSTTLTSATADFTTADIGNGVAVAGASSGYLMALINSITSSTAVVLNTEATTTVTGATASVGVATLDGTHPTTFSAEQIAASLNLSVI